MSAQGRRRPGEHRGADPGGKAFAMVTVAPALLVMAWLLTGLPLLLAGRFFPVPMVLISVPVAVGLVMVAARYPPGRWPGQAIVKADPAASVPVEAAAGEGTAGEAVAGDGASGGDTLAERPGERAQGKPAPGWAAWWGLVGTVVAAVAFALWQFRANSPQLIVDRDPGAYFQFGYWIALHGSLPITPLPAAFGGSHPGLTFSTFGFTGQAGAVVPQLAAGLPVTLAAGMWAHGLAGGAAMSPLLGAFAVLSVGGLTGRLAGPQWAPVGAFLLALSLPETYTSRSAFSEILVQVLLFGGLCLVADSVISGRAGALASFGGCALGLTVLVGAGSLVYLLPAIVFEGVLLAGRRPQALPFGGGLLVGVACGLAGGYVLAGPMMSALRPQLALTGLAAAGFAAITLAGAAAGLVEPLRRRCVRLLTARPLRWLPEAGAVLVALVAVGFVIRPDVQTVRGAANPYVTALQRISQLPVDPHRLYAEDSLYWVIWYLGAPALLLAVVGLALLTRQCLRALITWRDPAGTARAWALPLMVIGWGTVAVLWRPGTIPDQPWASRRLVPVLLPGLIVAAVWVCAWLATRARERGAGVAAVSAAVGCFVAALAVPSAVTTFGIGAAHAGPPVAHTATGLAFQQTGAGELSAIRGLCGAIPGTASVLLLDRVAARRFTQVIRGMCGIPSAAMAGATPAQVEVVISGIARAGRLPVLLATRPGELTPYRAPPRRVMDLATIQDPHVLTQPPASGWPVRYVLWMSGPGTAGGLTGGA
ncbi:MAG TPA: hypothetical protein VMV17_04615 [Streptosporangiaceae bacterium]|nr:hypothetical protein [Streptosporangiaceae bacterium]